MTTPPVHVLLLKLPQLTVISCADAVRSFEKVDLREDVEKNKFIDLDRALGQPLGGSQPQRQIIVHPTLSNRIPLLSRAEIAMSSVERNCFYRLPTLLEKSGCQPWVKGVVKLPSKVIPQHDLQNETRKESPSPLGIWIDLPMLINTFDAQRRGVRSC